MFNPCRAEADSETMALENLAAIQPAMMGLWFPGIGGCAAQTMLPVGTPVSSGCRRGVGATKRASRPRIPRGCKARVDHKGLWVCCQGVCRLAYHTNR